MFVQLIQSPLQISLHISMYQINGDHCAEEEAGICLAHGGKGHVRMEAKRR